MLRLLAILIIAATAAVCMETEVEAANKLECKAVDSLAVAAFFDWDTVNVLADEDDDECRYSINNATSGSPPQEAVRDAARQLLGPPNLPSSGTIQAEIDVDQIAHMLLAVGPDDSIDNMSRLLSGATTQLEACRSAIFSNDQMDLRNIASRDGIECGAFPSGSSDELFRIGPVRAFVDGELRLPRFVVVVRHDNLWNILSFAVRR